MLKIGAAMWAQLVNFWANMWYQPSALNTCPTQKPAAMQSLKWQLMDQFQEYRQFPPSTKTAQQLSMEWDATQSWSARRDGQATLPSVVFWAYPRLQLPYDWKQSPYTKTTGHQWLTDMKHSMSTAVRWFNFLHESVESSMLFAHT